MSRQLEELNPIYTPSGFPGCAHAAGGVAWECANLNAGKLDWLSQLQRLGVLVAVFKKQPVSGSSPFHKAYVASIRSRKHILATRQLFEQVLRF